MAHSPWRAMWLFAMFDLPVETAELRKAANQFRKRLKKEGFVMLQFSVYARYCPTEESSLTYRAHIKTFVPAEGQVRVLSVTDIQFGKMEVYFGKSRKPVEDPPPQLMLF